nr:site-specific DNA-methyltransferase [Moraxellaceae bacterium]
PYNTGSDGFVYQDDRKFSKEQLAELTGMSEDEAERVLKFTDKKSNSHSAWLTFMYPRLYIARTLLQQDGVIFISIDDNEVAQLRLLCDEVFGEENFVAELPTIMNLKGNNDEFGFAGTHEYTLVYCKNKNKMVFNNFILNKEESEEWLEDEIGFFKKGANLKATGADGAREKRPNLFYPIYVNQHLNISLKKLDGYVEVLPITDGQEMRWRWSKETFLKNLNDVIVSETKNGFSFYKKQRPELGDLPSKKPKSTFYKPQYSSGNGTAQIKNLFSKKLFTNPKPKDLIKDLITIGANKNDLILDFFAGSGTTADAVMQLNAEDGGNRQFILVQLPEPIDPKKSKTAYDFVKNELDVAEPTIFEITKERIIRSAKKILAENDVETGHALSVQGFKIYETVDNFCLATDNKLSLNQEIFPKQDFTEKQYQTLLTSWRLHDGNCLTDSVITKKLADYTAYLCDKNLYLLHSNFNSTSITALIESLDKEQDFIPNRIIFYGEHIDSSKQKELQQALDSYTNKKDLKISLLARY